MEINLRFFLKIPIIGLLLHKLLWYAMVKKKDFFATLAFYNKKLATKDLVQKYRELAINSQMADFKTFTLNGMDAVTDAVESNS